MLNDRFCQNQDRCTESQSLCQSNPRRSLYLQAFEILVHALSVLGSLLLCNGTFDYGISVSGQVGHPVIGRAVAGLQAKLLHLGGLCCCLSRHLVCVCVCLFSKIEYVSEDRKGDTNVFVVGMIDGLVQKRWIIYVESILARHLAFASPTCCPEPKRASNSPFEGFSEID